MIKPFIMMIKIIQKFILGIKSSRYNTIGIKRKKA
jgi:hypothetical protein